MIEKPLDRLAEAYGLQLSYLSESNELRAPPDSAKRAVLRAMGVAADDTRAIERSLAKAPPPVDARIRAPRGVRCFMPDWLERGRAWGLICQLYSLRSARNCGIGDFEDLARLAERAAEDGADFIGINPVHALFMAASERCSPFSPSNRRYLNPLYIALDRLPGIAQGAPVDEALRARLCNEARVEYRAVAQLKLGALDMLWRRIAEEPGLWAPESRADFDAFVAAGGAGLLAHARFEALSRRMVADGKGPGWHTWPGAYRNAGGEAVARFAAEHVDEVRFHLWLQWIADRQLGAAAERARAAGMRIGLYLDFAVGNAPDGSATWTDPALVVPGAHIGAPPDPMFEAGQDWGLAPMSPVVLRARDLAPYRSVLEIAMRHAGAIRIDHAMGLHRLFWVPHGCEPPDGCFVLNPMVDMLRAVAEVSTATGTVVIGEDLGTVPKGFSQTIRRAGMLTSRVLFFERTRGGFRVAATYPRNALLSASTHDLPPLAAWWEGGDIVLFRRLGLIDERSAARRRTRRTRARRALIAQLRKESERRPFRVASPAFGNARDGGLTEATAAAIHGYLARTPSRLLAVQFEDLCGADQPVNVPGTSEEYPNWRLRAPKTIEDAPESSLWAAIVAAVAFERPRAP